MIQVENLTKYYGDFCAVDGISLTIGKGEILGLLGPNGAGKTTTLRMLTGYFKPTSGNIQVKDYSIHTDALKIKSLIGYLPESAPLYHNMLVYDYLDYVARVKGIARDKRDARLHELATLCGLYGIMHQSIDELSKGLRQRVGLAHALMTDPEILVLDEPTSGLDPNQIAEIRAIIRRIGREKTIIFSTHILSEAESTCDRIVIVDRGRIVADDTTENLKKGARQESRIRVCVTGADDAAGVGKLLGSIPGVTDVHPVETPEAGAVSFEITAGGNADIRQDIYLRIKETDWILVELSREAKTLERIFQELTRRLRQS